jgi:anti-sigma regulatory factor (Ser/Thr protein kinase)
MRREACIANQRSAIRSAVALVEELGAAHDIPQAITNDVSVALDEVLSNVIAYGYEQDAEDQISVKLCYDRGELMVEVEDGGRAFDPLQAPPPDLIAPLHERKVGGLGIHLIRSLMDHVTYDRIGGKNRLRMVKKTPPANP